MMPQMRPTEPPDLNALALTDLYAHFAATGLIRRVLELARDEDLGPPKKSRENDPESSEGGIDVTTAASIHPDIRAEARLNFRTEGIVAGLAALPDVLRVFAPSCSVESFSRDGQRVPAGTCIATIRGPLDEILELERTMLNLISRLSGIATRTAEFVGAIPPGSRAKLYDTRKTTPGLRVLEKYAVRCGGGMSHRIGLYDAMLMKDNHFAALGANRSGAAFREFVAHASAQARRIASQPLAFVEVEVDTLDQFRALLELPPGTINIVLLDNMGPSMLREAAALRDQKQPRLQLEASGGITLASIPEIAKSGVDRISTGSITHSAVSIDIGLDIA